MLEVNLLAWAADLPSRLANMQASSLPTSTRPVLQQRISMFEYYAEIL